MSSSSINIQKKEFIEFYLKEGERISGDKNYIIDLSKYLLNALKFNDGEREVLISMTADSLSEILHKEREKPNDLKGLELNVEINGYNYVDFFIENGNVVPRYSSK